MRKKRMQWVQVAYQWYYSYVVSEEEELVVCVIMPLFWLLQPHIRTYPTFHEYMNMVFERIAELATDTDQDQEEEGEE